MLIGCKERERLAAVYLAAVAKAKKFGNVSGDADNEAALMALYEHQMEHGCS
jgi:hypothetical protein